MFKDKLKELRESKKISQYELAESIHVSRAAISKWEMGNGLPSDVTLEALCEYFEVREEELLDIVDYKNKIEIASKKNILFLLSGVGIILMIALTLFSLIPIYQYIGFSSFMIANESIISVVDEWGIFPMIIYSITGCVSILFLFDFVDLSIKKKTVIILILILFSLLIFIIYFIWSYVVIDKRYYLLFIFFYF
jgi:transcriptional regulator with XRE-family HTH domain